MQQFNNILGWQGHLSDNPPTDDDAWYGPKQGTVAWQCFCGCFAMYYNGSGMFCWDCQKEQVFA